MTKSLMCILFALCTFSVIRAQDYKTGKVIPPSPTAAALGSYGNTPMNLYNGTPSISIPLHNISTSNHSLNISLNYDASGVRVAQDASWVGLGWSLSAGGAITRTIRQQDDFNSHGYYTYAALPTSSVISTEADRQYMYEIYYGRLDAEPDIYSYNFDGHSGRFILGKQQDGSPIFMDEKNDLDIKYISGGWVVTTGEAYKYYFSTVERAQDYSKTALFETPDFTGITGLNQDMNSISPITAWYLDSIVAPTKEAVRFTYVKGKSLSLINRSETFVNFNRVLFFECSVPYGPTNLAGNHDYTVSRQEMVDIYLQRISFYNGTVEFNTSTRNDLEYLGTPSGVLTPSKLDNIVVKNAAGAQLKKYNFFYSYFGSADIYGRLKLDSIVEAGSTTTTKPPYKFTYFNANNVPAKSSKSIDHWGFYNAAPNYTYLPSTSFPTSAQSFDGASREPDTVSVFPSFGVLSSLTYPTGGSTQFEYELHDYSNLRNAQKYKTINKYASVSANPDLYQDKDIDINFIILPDPEHPLDKIPVTYMCSYQKVNPNLSDLTAQGYSNMWKINSDGTQTQVAGCTMANYDQPNPSPTQFSHMFDPGTYRMRVQSITGWSTFMSITWPEKTLITENQRKGGGIRIKSITDLDQNGHQTVKKYQYTLANGKSSGILMGYPKYDVTFNATMLNMYQNNVTLEVTLCRSIGEYTQLLSGSLYPTGLSSKSGIIGYSKVTELLGANGENGKTEYCYHNREEYVDDFPGAPTVADALNGKLDSVLVYNANGLCLKKTAYDYLVKEQDNITGIKMFTSSALQGDGNLANLPQFYFRFYKSYSSWAVKAHEYETIFDGSKGVNTFKNYYYDNSSHRQLTREELIKSDGSIYITKYRRPGDFNATGGNSFVEKMIAQHVISPVIEQQNFVRRNGTESLVSSVFTNYKLYNNRFYKPDLIQKFETNAAIVNPTTTSFQTNGQLVLDTRYKPQVYFDSYDTLGNILQMHKLNDARETYFWGYSSQYPVAKIVGADYNTVSPYVTQSLLDNLNLTTTDQQIRDHLAALRAQFPTALITTYTYIPQIGMTSETDARGKTNYYEYDNMGRLSILKDQDGNIIKTMDYNYKK